MGIRRHYILHLFIVTKEALSIMSRSKLLRSLGGKTVVNTFRHLSTQHPSLTTILESVREGKLKPSEAENLIKSSTSSNMTPEDTLQSFANLDHNRTNRTGFPEAVFAAGKTPYQVAKILDDMARSLNEKIKYSISQDETLLSSQRAILATRVSPEQYDDIKILGLQNGTIEYNEMARIITMKASGLEELPETGDKTTEQIKKRIIVATAGTTDLPVAEEAATVLEAANCDVERIFDVGVAGLHRIINALPRLQSEDVGCVIVCAGMDGALPSVVGGLVSVPVIAVPTSIGYGVSLGGISAMLTMLNSCAPGVGVVNIDNGFGAAALAYKCILP